MSRLITTRIYDYDDMLALEEMPLKKVKEVLQGAYRGHINQYMFPKREDYREYSEDEYYRYKIQCAFEIAYRILERAIENDKNYKRR